MERGCKFTLPVMAEGRAVWGKGAGWGSEPVTCALSHAPTRYAPQKGGNPAQTLRLPGDFSIAEIKARQRRFLLVFEQLPCAFPLDRTVASVPAPGV
ncbi:hypothetical protein JZ751_014640 [Albula glossodonta]|uniref:Uncharacterized protein n=1 Tax=Albula glossodonta TaxID=121402 RepID=A0A8T2N4C3_9TELE|nr:hypothetical protein JZ751_014640 [Albula glossodonta]